jgi:DNA polymerase-4
MRPAAAVAGNKLVGKVAARVIRPAGLIQIQNGTEAVFMAHQDIRLLPGMGPGLLKIAAVTGFREIGELACLNDGEALSLFGKWGPLLRDTARGSDDSPVEAGDLNEKRIEKRLDFAEDVVDYDVIRGGLIFLCESAGLDMRRARLGAGCIQLAVTYADGMRVMGQEKKKRQYITDKELAEGAERIYRKVVIRRLRVRSVTLVLGDLRPLGWEADLFLPDEDMRQRSLQEAADGIRGRYGLALLTKGSVMAAAMRGSALALPGPAHA